MNLGKRRLLRNTIQRCLVAPDLVDDVRLGQGLADHLLVDGRVDRARTFERVLAGDEVVLALDGRVAERALEDDAPRILSDRRRAARGHEQAGRQVGVG